MAAKTRERGPHGGRSGKKGVISGGAEGDDDESHCHPMETVTRHDIRKGVHSARIYARVFTGQDGARLPPLRALTAL